MGLEVAFHGRVEEDAVFNLAGVEAHPGGEAPLAAGKFEYPGSVGLEVVIDGVAAAEPAIDQHYAHILHHEVVVVFVAADDGLDVAVQFHSLEEAGVEPGAAYVLAHVADEGPAVVSCEPEAVVEFCGRNVEEGERMDGRPAVFLFEFLAVGVVPLDLVGPYVVVASVGDFHRAAGVEKVEDPVHAALTREGDDVVGRFGDAFVGRCVDVVGDGTDNVEDFGAAETEFTVVVAKGYGEGYLSF